MDITKENNSNKQECCVPQAECSSTPLEAHKNSPQEKLMYVTIIPSDTAKPDYLATIDLDTESKTYSQIIHRLSMPNVNDELHHFGWNACISCTSNQQKHNYLVIPGLISGNIYIVDVQKNPLQPQLHKVISGEQLQQGTKGGFYPHTVHCIPSGEVMVSLMGDSKGGKKGSFALLEPLNDWNLKGVWENEENVEYNYDFWYQPRHNVMISSEFGTPSSFLKGFDPQQVQSDYGNKIVFWDWSKKKVINKVSLGADSLIPLEVRFLHNPDASYGYLGVTLSSCIVKFYKENDEWKCKKVYQVPSLKVEGWALPEMPGFISDILISLDDKYLFVSCWLHGKVLQLDISGENSDSPKLVGELNIAGSLLKGGNVSILDENNNRQDNLLKEPTKINNKVLQGGPQMLQLSKDGKRLYITSSLLRPWDNQFYPNMVKEGGWIIKANVDNEKGGLSLDQNFLVDLQNEIYGPALAHEMRFPGGDCTSDIWA